VPTQTPSRGAADGQAAPDSGVTRKIGALIANQGLTQASAAELLKIDQPKVSALVRGRLAGCSVGTFVHATFRFCDALMIPSLRR
jgi:hypothetical protein